MRSIYVCIWICIIPLQILALPGDVLFSDDFERSDLGSDWSVSDTDRAGISTQTSNSGTSSMYTRHDEVTVTSKTINLSVDGAKLEMWIRKGDDSFSEDPDADNEDLLVEYLNDSGVWNEIYRADAQDMSPGEIYTMDYQLPEDALYANFQLRVRQIGGSGDDWDYWHIDDVNITETGYVAPPPPLIVGQCDEFEGDLSNWVVGDRVDITKATANSPTHSLSINGGDTDATSIDIDTSSNFKELTVWIRRGSDDFSEDPDSGEDLVLEYYDAAGNWQSLETFTGSGTAGEVFERTYSMSDDAKHGAFKIRLRMTGGNGGNYDYWHVDDVCLVPETYMRVTKTSCVINDPVNHTSNPKRIPGATIRYAVQVENITDFDTDSNIVEDTVDTYFDVATIRNLQIQDGACDCIDTDSASNNGANGSGNGENPVKLDYESVTANSKECGYFEVDIR